MLEEVEFIVAIKFEFVGKSLSELIVDVETERITPRCNHHE